MGSVPVHDTLDEITSEDPVPQVTPVINTDATVFNFKITLLFQMKLFPEFSL